MRQQEEKQRSPADRAKDVEELGSRIDDMERSVASLDKKMDESHRRLESMLKLLLAKGGPTPPEDEAPVVAAEEDNSNVHALHEDMALSTIPQTMPSPTHDTTEVAEEGDALDAGNEEESEEIRKEEVLQGGGSEEVLQGGVSEEVLGGASQEKGPESLATRPGAGETPAREKGMEVAVQKVRATANNKTKKTPKVVDSEKPEQVNCANA